MRGLSLPLPDLLLDLRLQVRAWWAIILHETRTGGKQSYIWEVVEFALLVGGLMVLVEVIRTLAPAGLEIAPFFVSGFITFKCFRLTYSSSRRPPKKRRVPAELPVTPLDVMIARSFVHYLIMVIVAVMTICALWGLGLGPWPATWTGLFCDMAVAGLLGFGIGLIVSSASVFVPWLQSIAWVIFKLFFMLAGVFFIPAMIPEPYREYFLWIPLVHVTEAARVSYFASFTDTYGSLSYVAWWILATFCIGLAFHRIVRDRVGTKNGRDYEREDFF